MFCFYALYFFFYKIFMHFTCLLLLAAGEMVGQCMCTDLFAFIYFLFFLLNCFFTLWSNILWFVWVLYCSVCVCEYLFYIYLRLWMLCCWINWDFECCVVEYLFEILNVVLLYVNICVVEYLFKTLNVGMCGVVVFVLTE